MSSATEGEGCANLPTATAVYVLFQSVSLDLTWLPEGVEVIVVHNDEGETSIIGVHPVRHIRSATNLGFGAGVNLAALQATGQRLVLVNPDTRLDLRHWAALQDGKAAEIVVVPLIDPEGHATSVVSRYPTPLSLALTAWRVGRLPLLSRGAPARRLLTRMLGRWGREHERLRASGAGSWPLETHWGSGAAMSVDRSRFEAVGGFDEAYFLYLEDADLCERMAARFPGMRVRVGSVVAGSHLVSQSSASPAVRRQVDRSYAASARRYAARRGGLAWGACRVALACRAVVAGRR